MIDTEVRFVRIEKAKQKVQRELNRGKKLELHINEKAFSQPLGKITAQASEFNKSLEASNARVLAFGASVGVMNAVGNAFAALVTESIEFKKILQDVNVILNLNQSQLNKFGSELFKVSQNTAQSFNVAAEAALEFSRQGLNLEEVIQRTNAALILTRITSLDAASAVKGLTAAVNGFADAGLTTAEIVDKLSAVDVRFAVSSEDLINALSRSSAVAQDAGVSFDQLIGAVAAAQQITARGGNVIGNSFKTIFTRLGRSTTIDALGELGIAVKDVEGNTLPAIKIMDALAKTYDTLGASTKSAVAEQVGGVFQINILKAIMKDLSREQSISQKATLASANAFGEAAIKNERLNETLSATATQAGLELQKLSAVIGDLTLDETLTNLVGAVKGGATFLNDIFGGQDGEEEGSKIARGILKGISNILSGPGVVMAATVIFRLFGNLKKFATEAFQDFSNIKSKRYEQKQIEESINNLLNSDSDLRKQMLSLGDNRISQEKKLLDIIRQQTQLVQSQQKVARNLAPRLQARGVQADLTIRNRAATGQVPNFSKKTEAQQASKLYNRKVNEDDAYATTITKNNKKEKVIVNNQEEIITKKDFKTKYNLDTDGDAILPPKDTNVGKQRRKEMFEKIGAGTNALKYKNVNHKTDPTLRNKGYIPNFRKEYLYEDKLGAAARSVLETGEKIKNVVVKPDDEQTLKHYGARNKVSLVPSFAIIGKKIGQGFESDVFEYGKNKVFKKSSGGTTDDQYYSKGIRTKLFNEAINKKDPIMNMMTAPDVWEEAGTILRAGLGWESREKVRGLVQNKIEGKNILQVLRENIQDLPTEPRPKPKKNPHFKDLFSGFSSVFDSKGDDPMFDIEKTWNKIAQPFKDKLFNSMVDKEIIYHKNKPKFDSFPANFMVTKEKEKTLVDLFKNNYSIDEIAEKMGPGSIAAIDLSKGFIPNFQKQYAYADKLGYRAKERLDTGRGRKKDIVSANIIIDKINSSEEGSVEEHRMLATKFYNKLKHKKDPYKDSSLKKYKNILNRIVNPKNINSTWKQIDKDATDNIVKILQKPTKSSGQESFAVNRIQGALFEGIAQQKLQQEGDYSPSKGNQPFDGVIGNDKFVEVKSQKRIRMNTLLNKAFNNYILGNSGFNRKNQKSESIHIPGEYRFVVPSHAMVIGEETQISTLGKRDRKNIQNAYSRREKVKLDKGSEMNSLPFYGKRMTPNFAKKKREKFPRISQNRMEDNLRSLIGGIEPDKLRYFSRGYEDYNNLIKAFSGPLGYDELSLASAMAAVSPSNSVENNVLDMVELALGHRQKMDYQDLKVYGTGSSRKKAYGSLSGEGFGDEKKAPKTNSFINNMMDPFNPDRVTVDYRATNQATNKKYTTKSIPDLKVDNRYGRIENAFKNVAGENEMVPSGLQAALWIHERIGTTSGKAQSRNRGLIAHLFNNPEILRNLSHEDFRALKLNHNFTKKEDELITIPNFAKLHHASRSKSIGFDKNKLFHLGENYAIRDIAKQRSGFGRDPYNYIHDIEVDNDVFKGGIHNVRDIFGESGDEFYEIVRELADKKEFENNKEFQKIAKETDLPTLPKDLSKRSKELLIKNGINLVKYKNINEGVNRNKLSTSFAVINDKILKIKGNKYEPISEKDITDTMEKNRDAITSIVDDMSYYSAREINLHDKNYTPKISEKQYDQYHKNEDFLGWYSRGFVPNFSSLHEKVLNQIQPKNISGLKMGELFSSAGSKAKVFDVLNNRGDRYEKYIFKQLKGKNHSGDNYLERENKGNLWEEVFNKKQDPLFELMEVQKERFVNLSGQKGLLQKKIKGDTLEKFLDREGFVYGSPLGDEVRGEIRQGIDNIMYPRLQNYLKKGGSHPSVNGYFGHDIHPENIMIEKGKQKDLLDLIFYENFDSQKYLDVLGPNAFKIIDFNKGYIPNFSNKFKFSNNADFTNYKRMFSTTKGKDGNNPYIDFLEQDKNFKISYMDNAGVKGMGHKMISELFELSKKGKKSLNFGPLINQDRNQEGLSDSNIKKFKKSYPHVFSLMQNGMVSSGNYTTRKQKGEFNNIEELMNFVQSIDSKEMSSMLINNVVTRHAEGKGDGDIYEKYKKLSTRSRGFIPSFSKKKMPSLPYKESKEYQRVDAYSKVLDDIGKSLGGYANDIPLHDWSEEFDKNTPKRFKRLIKALKKEDFLGFDHGPDLFDTLFRDHDNATDIYDIPPQLKGELTRYMDYSKGFVPSFAKKVKELLIVRGPPGSGKSTIARESGHKNHFEADMFFEKDGEYNFDPSKIKEAHAWCMKMTEKTMKKGEDVVVSNTFTKQWEMQAYRDFAKKYGYRIKEQTATGRFQNVHGVPDNIVERMRDNFEPTPNIDDEGYLTNLYNKSSGFIPSFADSVINTNEVILEKDGKEAIIPPNDAKNIDFNKVKSQGFKVKTPKSVESSLPKQIVHKEKSGARKYGYNPGSVIPYQTKGKDSGKTVKQFISERGLGKDVPNFADYLLDINGLDHKELYKILDDAIDEKQITMSEFVFGGPEDMKKHTDSRGHKIISSIDDVKKLISEGEVHNLIGFHSKHKDESSLFERVDKENTVKNSGLRSIYGFAKKFNFIGSDESDIVARALAAQYYKTGIEGERKEFEGKTATINTKNQDDFFHMATTASPILKSEIDAIKNSDKKYKIIRIKSNPTGQKTYGTALSFEDKREMIKKSLPGVEGLSFVDASRNKVAERHALIGKTVERIPEATELISPEERRKLLKDTKTLEKNLPKEIAENPKMLVPLLERNMLSFAKQSKEKNSKGVTKVIKELTKEHLFYQEPDAIDQTVEDFKRLMSGDTPNEPSSQSSNNPFENAGAGGLNSPSNPLPSKPFGGLGHPSSPFSSQSKKHSESTNVKPPQSGSYQQSEFDFGLPDNKTYKGLEALLGRKDFNIKDYNVNNDYISKRSDIQEILQAQEDLSYYTDEAHSGIGHKKIDLARIRRVTKNIDKKDLEKKTPKELKELRDRLLSTDLDGAGEIGALSIWVNSEQSKQKREMLGLEIPDNMNIIGDKTKTGNLEKIIAFNSNLNLDSLTEDEKQRFKDTLNKGSGEMTFKRDDGSTSKINSDVSLNTLLKWKMAGGDDQIANRYGVITELMQSIKTERALDLKKSTTGYIKGGDKILKAQRHNEKEIAALYPKTINPMVQSGFVKNKDGDEREKSWVVDFLGTGLNEKILKDPSKFRSSMQAGIPEIIYKTATELFNLPVALQKLNKSPEDLKRAFAANVEDTQTPVLVGNMFDIIVKSLTEQALSEQAGKKAVNQRIDIPKISENIKKLVNVPQGIKQLEVKGNNTKYSKNSVAHKILLERGLIAKEGSKTWSGGDHDEISLEQFEKGDYIGPDGKIKEDALIALGKTNKDKPLFNDVDAYAEDEDRKLVANFAKKIIYDPKKQFGLGGPLTPEQEKERQNQAKMSMGVDTNSEDRLFTEKQIIGIFPDGHGPQWARGFVKKGGQNMMVDFVGTSLDKNKFKSGKKPFEEEVKQFTLDEMTKIASHHGIIDAMADLNVQNPKEDFRRRLSNSIEETQTPVFSGNVFDVLLKTFLSETLRERGMADPKFENNARIDIPDISVLSDFLNLSGGLKPMSGEIKNSRTQDNFNSIAHKILVKRGLIQGVEGSNKIPGMKEWAKGEKERVKHLTQVPFLDDTKDSINERAFNIKSQSDSIQPVEGFSSDEDATAKKMILATRMLEGQNGESFAAYLEKELHNKLIKQYPSDNPKTRNIIGMIASAVGSQAKSRKMVGGEMFESIDHYFTKDFMGQFEDGADAKSLRSTVQDSLNDILKSSSSKLDTQAPLLDQAKSFNFDFDNTLKLNEQLEKRQLEIWDKIENDFESKHLQNRAANPNLPAVPKEKKRKLIQQAAEQNQELTDLLRAEADQLFYSHYHESDYEGAAHALKEQVNQDEYHNSSGIEEGTLAYLRKQIRTQTLKDLEDKREADKSKKHFDFEENHKFAKDALSHTLESLGMAGSNIKTEELSNKVRFGLGGVELEADLTKEGRIDIDSLKTSTGYNLDFDQRLAATKAMQDQKFGKDLQTNLSGDVVVTPSLLEEIKEHYKETRLNLAGEQFKDRDVAKIMSRLTAMGVTPSQEIQEAFFLQTQSGDKSKFGKQDFIESTYLKDFGDYYKNDIEDRIKRGENISYLDELDKALNKNKKQGFFGKFFRRSNGFVPNFAATKTGSEAVKAAKNIPGAKDAINREIKALTSRGYSHSKALQNTQLTVRNNGFVPSFAGEAAVVTNRIDEGHVNPSNVDRAIYNVHKITKNNPKFSRHGMATGFVPNFADNRSAHEVLQEKINEGLKNAPSSINLSDIKNKLNEQFIKFLELGNNATELSDTLKQIDVDVSDQDIGDAFNDLAGSTDKVKSRLSELVTSGLQVPEAIRVAREERNEQAAKLSGKAYERENMSMNKSLFGRMKLSEETLSSRMRFKDGPMDQQHIDTLGQENSADIDALRHIGKQKNLSVQQTLEEVKRLNLSKEQTKAALKVLGFKEQEVKAAQRQIKQAQKAEKQRGMGMGFSTALFSIPMGIGMLQEQLFGQKKRYELTEGQRRAQGAMEGANSGVMIASLLDGFDLPPKAKMALQLASIAVPALVKSIQAAGLSFKDLAEKAQDGAAEIQQDLTAFSQYLSLSQKQKSLAGSLTPLQQREIQIQKTRARVSIKDPSILKDFDAAAGSDSKQQEIKLKIMEQQAQKSLMSQIFVRSQEHSKLLKKSFSDKNFDQSELAIESSRLGNSIGGVIASGMNKDNAEDVMRSMAHLRDFQNKNKESLYYANLNENQIMKEKSDIYMGKIGAGAAAGGLIGGAVGTFTGVSLGGGLLSAPAGFAGMKAGAGIGAGIGAGVGAASGFLESRKLDKKIKKAKIALSGNLDSFKKEWLGELQELEVISDEMRLDLAKTPMTQEIMDALRDMIESQAKSIVGGQVDNILSVNYKLASDILKDKLTEQINASAKDLRFEERDLKIDRMNFRSKQQGAAVIFSPQKFTETNKQFDLVEADKKFKIQRQKWMDAQSDQLRKRFGKLYEGLGLEGVHNTENAIEEFRSNPEKMLKKYSEMFKTTINRNALKDASRQLEEGTLEYTDTLINTITKSKESIIQSLQSTLDGNGNMALGIPAGELSEAKEKEISQRIKNELEEINTLKGKGSSEDKRQVIESTLNKLDKVSAVQDFVESFQTNLSAMADQNKIEKDLIKEKYEIARKEKENILLQKELQREKSNVNYEMNSSFMYGRNFNFENIDFGTKAINDIQQKIKKDLEALSLLPQVKPTMKEVDKTEIENKQKYIEDLKSNRVKLKENIIQENTVKESKSYISKIKKGNNEENANSIIEEYRSNLNEVNKILSEGQKNTEHFTPIVEDLKLNGQLISFSFYDKFSEEAKMTKRHLERDMAWLNDESPTNPDEKTEHETKKKKLQERYDRVSQLGTQVRLELPIEKAKEKLLEIQNDTRYTDPHGGTYKRYDVSDTAKKGSSNILKNNKNQIEEQYKQLEQLQISYNQQLAQNTISFAKELTGFLKGKLIKGNISHNKEQLKNKIDKAVNEHSQNFNKIFDNFYTQFSENTISENPEKQLIDKESFAGRKELLDYNKGQLRQELSYTNKNLLFERNQKLEKEDFDLSQVEKKFNTIKDNSNKLLDSLNKVITAASLSQENASEVEKSKKSLVEFMRGIDFSDLNGDKNTKETLKNLQNQLLSAFGSFASSGIEVESLKSIGNDFNNSIMELVVKMALAQKNFLNKQITDKYINDIETNGKIAQQQFFSLSDETQKIALTATNIKNAGAIAQENFRKSITSLDNAFINAYNIKFNPETVKQTITNVESSKNTELVSRLKELDLQPETFQTEREKISIHKRLADRGLAFNIKNGQTSSSAITREEQARRIALANRSSNLTDLKQSAFQSKANFDLAKEVGNQNGMANATLEYYETQKKLNEELGKASQYTDQYLVELAKINERIVNFKADLAGSIVGGLNSGLKDGMRNLFDIREREKDKENGIGAAEGFMLRTAGGVLNSVSDRYIQDAADKLTTGLSSLFGKSLEDPEKVMVKEINNALDKTKNKLLDFKSAVEMAQYAAQNQAATSTTITINSSDNVPTQAKGNIQNAIQKEKQLIQSLPEYRNNRDAKPRVINNFGPKNETIVANDKEYVDTKLGIVLNPQQRQFHNFASGNEPKVRNIDPADLKKLFKAGRNMRGGRDAYKNLSGRALASNKMIQGYGQDLVRLQDYKNAEMTRKTEERYNKYTNLLVNPLKNIVMGDVMGRFGSFIGEVGKSISNWRTNRKMNSEKGMRLEGGNRVRLAGDGKTLQFKERGGEWVRNPELQARYNSVIERQKSGESVNIGQNLGASSWLSDMFNKAFASNRAKGSSEYELARLTKGEIVKPLDRNIIDQTRKEVVAQNMNFGQDISDFKISQDPSKMEATGTGALLRNKIQDLAKGGIVEGKYGKDTNVGLIKRDSTIINPKHLNGYYYGKNQPINPTRNQTNTHSNTNNQSSVPSSANTNNAENSTTNNISDNTTSNKNVENVDNSTQNTVTNNFEIHVTVNHAGEVKEASVSGNAQMNTDQQELKDKIQNAIIQALAEQRDRPGGEFDY